MSFTVSQISYWWIGYPLLDIRGSLFQIPIQKVQIGFSPNPQGKMDHFESFWMGCFDWIAATYKAALYIFVEVIPVVLVVQPEIPKSWWHLKLRAARDISSLEKHMLNLNPNPRINAVSAPLCPRNTGPFHRPDQKNWTIEANIVPWMHKNQKFWGCQQMFPCKSLLDVFPTSNLTTN